MEDERDKTTLPADEGDDVEAHKHEPGLWEAEKHQSSTDDDDDVVAHKH